MPPYRTIPSNEEPYLFWVQNKLVAALSLHHKLLASLYRGRRVQLSVVR